MSHAAHPRRLAAVVALATALAAFPLGTLASHDFADVPDSNVFHADISALADSGVTTGCGGGNYCPSAFVTREQMAAFMNRLGALGPGKVPVVNAAELNGFTSQQFVRSDAEHTGYATCSAAEMLTDSSADAWAATSYLKSPTAADNVEFTCGFDLPDGATITFFSATLYDLSMDERIKDCVLHRHLFATDSGTLVAALPATMDFTHTSGLYTSGSGFITNPVVDNANYRYLAGCVVEGFGTDIGVIAYSVTYTYTIGG